MVNSDLNLSKYKRLFTFGCSFTDYHWPTWADILGKHFKEDYYNFGATGCCNQSVFQSLIEANQLHNFQKTDLIIVQWTESLRDQAWRPDTGLSGCGSILHNHQYTIYTSEHFLKLNPVEFLKKDLDLIKAASMILNFLDVDFWMFSMNNIDYTESKSYPKIDYLLTMYQDVVSQLSPSFQTTVSWQDSKGIPAKAHYPNAFDNHPTPGMHLTHLNKVFPNLNLDPQILEFVDHYEKIVRSTVTDNSCIFEKKMAERMKWRH